MNTKAAVTMATKETQNLLMSEVCLLLSRSAIMPPGTDEIKIAKCVNELITPIIKEELVSSRINQD